MNEELKYLAAERLSQFLNAGAAHAGLQTLLAIAAKVDVTDLEGLPVLGFYETARCKEVERLLASGADHNMELVSTMKSLWEQTRKPRPSEE